MKFKKREPLPRAKTPSSILRQLANRAEKLFTGTFRQQYGALCFRYKDDGPEVEILIITSRDSGRWIIPKGWPMNKRKPYEAAAVEAWEEAGVRGVVSKRPIGHYTYLKDLDDGDFAPCIVDVFQVEVKELQGQFKELGQRDFAWVSPDEAARRVREIELKSLLIHFRPRPAKNAGKNDGSLFAGGLLIVRRV